MPDQCRPVASASAVARRIEELEAGFLDDLIALASIPSISTTGEDLVKCAEALARLVRSLGAEARILETGGAPLVWGAIGSGSPTLVIYGHYDVQPPDPVAAWSHPPFSPWVEDGAIYGRGVVDNKGQLIAHLCALRAWLDVFGEPPPFRIVFVFDGEEEIGSPTSTTFIREHPDLFAGDYLFDADGHSYVDAPALFLGVRGLLYIELCVAGASIEWHSGSYGGVLPNPAQRLAEALCSVVDRRGRVQVSGFYDDVRGATPDERELVARIPTEFLGNPQSFDVNYFATAMPRETMFFEPHLCVCGLTGGYTGEGMKTVVPTSARAKIDITLVPDQDPLRIARSLREHLDSAGFPDVACRVRSACPPVATPPTDPFVAVVVEALRSVWAVDPVVFPSVGGGGPLAAFTGYHGMPVVLAPYAQPDAHDHSADEHLSLEWFSRGIKTTAALFLSLANAQSEVLPRRGRSPQI